PHPRETPHAWGADQVERHARPRGPRGAPARGAHGGSAARSRLRFQRDREIAAVGWLAPPPKTEDWEGRRSEGFQSKCSLLVPVWVIEPFQARFECRGVEVHQQADREPG